MMINENVIHKGDIFYANLGVGGGSEQSGDRCVVVIQNNIGNKYSPTVIVASMTSKIKKIGFPTHVLISEKDYNIQTDSVIMAEQVRTLDKQRLRRKVDSLSKEDLCRLNEALNISLDLI